jgi:hypothetical protein
VYHRIETEEPRPNSQPPSRLPLGKQADVGEMLEDMQRRGVIEESDNSWSSAVVPVRKRMGTSASA